jgi:hypothetical protein
MPKNAQPEPEVDNLFDLVGEAARILRGDDDGPSGVGAAEPEPDNVIDVTEAQTPGASSAPPPATAVPAPASSLASSAGFDLHVTPAMIMGEVRQLFAELEELEGEVLGWPTEADLSDWHSYRARALRFLKLLVRHQGRQATAADWEALGCMRQRLGKFRLQMSSIRSAMVGGEGQGAKRGIPPILWIPIGIGAFMAAREGFRLLVESWGD